MWIAPGFIDIHVHGGAGHDTMDATPAALHGMARFFAVHGVTSFYPTTMTASRTDINAAIRNVEQAPRPPDGAQPLGLHLEGPYFNPDYKGAQPPTHLRNPIPDEYMPWITADSVKLITLAPELEGALALIEAGVQHGVEFAAGHTGADLECVSVAADLGLRQGTHTFNGMLGLHHRRPGTLGAILTEDRIYAQVIVDGIHVHPAMVKLLVRAKGIKSTVLITDAMRAAGLPDGRYMLGDSETFVKDGIARLAEGNLAGSTLTMDTGVRNLIAFAGLNVPDAVATATRTPAEAMRLEGRKGVLAPGADADVILLSEDVEVMLTMIAGNVVYERS
jgi:N-acetylglucosamine-6-phosphate deacetylase